jgi:hypothetical protein
MEAALCLIDLNSRESARDLGVRDGAMEAAPGQVDLKKQQTLRPISSFVT